MSRYAVRFESTVDDLAIWKVIEADDMEEIEAVAWEWSGRPGYSEGNYDIFVDSVDKSALEQAAMLLPDEKIEVIVIEPGQKPKALQILNDLSAFQSIVGGYIETVKLTGDAVLIVNEDGKNLRLAPNFYWQGDVIVGTAILARQEGDHFASVGDSWKELLHMRFIMDGGEV